jgi:molybdopterin/thiamine biosynthesis adenylyltransferase
MRRTLVVTRDLIESAQGLQADRPGATLTVGTSTSRLPDRVEYLSPAAAGEGPPLVLRVVQEHMRGMTAVYLRAFPRPAQSSESLELVLYPGRGASAFRHHQDGIDDLDLVRVTGAEFDLWDPVQPPTTAEEPISGDGEFSRRVGALGGAVVHERLCKARFAIVGVSRLGAAMASHLAHACVERQALIDADVVEAHLKDAMDADVVRFVGAPKVEAVQSRVLDISPASEVRAIALPLESPSGIAAAMEADVLVTCADRGRPRALAALLSSALLKVHLDIGTGLLQVGGERLIGADVRMMLPGRGCLLCNGGVELRDDARSWRQQRLGSLRSLNGVASSYAMLLLERLAGGTL